MDEIRYYIHDSWQHLKQFTNARIAIGRAGGSLSSAEQLKLFQAHAMARDAVHAEMHSDQLRHDVSFWQQDIINLKTTAADREQFLLRPDWGKKLKAESAKKLRKLLGNYDISLIVGDGLSAKAVNSHFAPLLKELLPKLGQYTLSPLCLVEQARVAVSDEIGSLLGSRLAVIFLGERPGLSSSDSLGIYLTYGPHPGQTDERRNCISNVRPEGMHYVLAAEKLAYLIGEALRRKISGVQLKDDLQINLEG